VIVTVLKISAADRDHGGRGLAQIGEFSFILANLAHDHGLLGEEAAMYWSPAPSRSITVNPLLFKLIPAMERGLSKFPLLRGLRARSGQQARRT